MFADRDITELLLTQSTIPDDIRQFRERCRQFPFVKDADANFTRIVARRTEDGRYRVEGTGALRIETKVLMKLNLSASGYGFLDPDRRVLRVHEVRIGNDFQGILNKLLQLTGVAVGKEIKVAKRDVEIVVREFSEARAAARPSNQPRNSRELSP